MLIWVFYLINLFLSIWVGSMAATPLGFVVFFIITFLFTCAISTIGMCLLSIFVPPTDKYRIKDIKTYRVKGYDSAYVYISDIDKIPMDFVSLTRITKGDERLERVSYTEGGLRGFWLWDSNSWPVEYILYKKNY